MDRKFIDILNRDRNTTLQLIAPFDGIVRMEQPQRFCIDATGTNIYTFTIRDTERLYKFQSIRFRLSTSVAAATRRQVIYYLNGVGQYIFYGIHPITIAASQGSNLNCAINLPSVNTTNLENNTPLPDIWLENGDQVVMTGVNLDGFDLIQNIVMIYTTILKQRF